MMKTLDSSSLSTIYLMPGQLYIARRPAAVRTILGSCLSMTLFARRYGVGAISHAMLPKRCRNGRCFSGHIEDCIKGIPDEDFFRFVDCSTHYMLDTFNRLGILNEELEVKIFGGADVLDSIVREEGPASVGSSNIEMARTIIEREKLKLTAWDIGGNRGRKIIFLTHTGEVYVKKLDKNYSI